MTTANQSLNSSEYEYGLFGCAVLEYNLDCQSALNMLSEGMLQNQESRNILKAIRNLELNKDPVDLINVSEELDRMKTGIPFNRVAELCKTHVRPHNAKAYAAKIRNVWQLNVALTKLDELKTSITTERDVRRALELLQGIGGEIKLDAGTKEPVRVDVAADDLLNHYMKVMDGEVIAGELTGCLGIDDAFGVINPTDLVVLSARPGQGKTELALAIESEFALRKNKPTLFISLEVEISQLAQRVLTAEAQISGEVMQNFKAFEEDHYAAKLANGIARLKDKPMYLHEMSAPTVQELAEVCRRFCTKNANAGMIAIDYLGLMDHGKADRNDISIGNTTRSLKALAMELKVPILLLVQPSRELEKRGGRPRMSDLRDSGAIEQDADKIVFIHRDCTIDPESEWKNIAELINVKRRQGQAKDGYMAFVNGHFVDCSDDDLALVSRIKNGAGKASGNGNKKTAGWSRGKQ